MTWTDWFVAPPDCYANNPDPGSCVPPGGIPILASVVILIAFGIWVAIKVNKTSR